MKEHALPIVAYAAELTANCIPLFIYNRKPFFGIIEFHMAAKILFLPNPLLPQEPPSP
jgi:hypothetical protein